MRFVALLLVVILVSGLVACVTDVQHETTVTTTYNYIYTPSETSAYVEETQSTVREEETTQQVEESATQETTTLASETTAGAETTTLVVETTVSAETTILMPQTTLPPETTTEKEITTQDVTETAPSVTASDITLNMSVPDANGTMEVDLSDDNKYTQIVVSERDIDSSLLVAVYSVPESGQNYVFEFSSAGAENRTAENIRRVYLIDSTGKIAYVAAAYSSEAENVSVVENWFNMNVLIKGMIFPAIEDKLK